MHWIIHLISLVSKLEEKWLKNRYFFHRYCANFHLSIQCNFLIVPPYFLVFQLDDFYWELTATWDRNKIHTCKPVGHQPNLIYLFIYLLHQIEGEVEKDSEVRATYKDLQAKRPICQKLIDHTEEIQPKEGGDETSEYRSTINKLEVCIQKCSDQSTRGYIMDWIAVKKINLNLYHFNVSP